MLHKEPRLLQFLDCVDSGVATQAECVEAVSQRTLMKYAHR